MADFGIDALHQGFWQGDVEANAVIGIGSWYREEGLSASCIFMRADLFQGGGGRSLLIVFGKPFHVESYSLGGRIDKLFKRYSGAGRAMQAATASGAIAATVKNTRQEIPQRSPSLVDRSSAR